MFSVWQPEGEEGAAGADGEDGAPKAEDEGEAKEAEEPESPPDVQTRVLFLEPVQLKPEIGVQCFIMNFGVLYSNPVLNLR